MEGDRGRMKEWIGQSCLLFLQRSDSKFFTVKRVLSVSDTHITFIDKFNNVYTERLDHVLEIKQDVGDGNGVAGRSE